MKLFVAVLSLVFISAFCHAQEASDPYKVGPILSKLAEIDLANQILPLVLSKDQIRKLLPKIEQCRANVKAQEKKEADRLKALQTDANKIHAEVVKGLVPPQEFLDKMTALFKSFENERKGVLMANTLIINDAVTDIFHEGQKKAAIGVVDKIYSEETKTWEDATPERKLRYFAVAILLNNDAYEFLVRLSTAK